MTSRIEAVGELQKAGNTKCTDNAFGKRKCRNPAGITGAGEGSVSSDYQWRETSGLLDIFVVEWYANGGKELTEQVQNAYESGKD